MQRAIRENKVVGKVGFVRSRKDLGRYYISGQMAGIPRGLVPSCLKL
jgi:hypothetical protein